MEADESRLIGAQRPALFTAPPRHREKQDGCKACSNPDYATGCGDHLSTEVLEWASSFWDLDDWQKFAMREYLGTKPDGRWAALENCGILPRQNGKGDRPLTEKLYTRRGWTTYLEVLPGDEVLGSDGKFTRVTGRSPVFTGRDCYKVTFSDGAELLASQYHLWHVKRKDDDQGWRDVPTEELSRSVGRRRKDNGRMEYNWRVRCDAVADTPEADLPVDPYLLGYWLGDGAARASTITCGTEDLPWVRRRLHEAGAVTPGWGRDAALPVIRGKAGSSALDLMFRIDAPVRDGFESRCRRLGTWDDKRIPEAYLTASVAQRKALLAGLMDSDGSVSTSNRTPQCEFTTSVPALADGFHRLARSLGIRTTRKTGRASLNGVRKKDRARFLFTCPFNPFEMPRKSERWRAPASSRHEVMSITSIVPVPSVPTRCIQVDAADGVYLTGELFTPTHNCLLEVRELAGLYLLGEADIVHTAHLFSTSIKHFQRVCDIVTNFDELRKRVKGKPNQTHGRESIRLRPAPTVIFGAMGKQVTQGVGGILEFVARSLGQSRGFTCDCLVYDEAMLLSAEQVGASRPTMAAVGNAQLWLMASAGMAGSDQLALMHERIEEDSQDLVGLEWGGITLHTPTCPRDTERGRKHNDYVVDCTEHDDRDDPEVWARANPALGIRISVDFIRSELTIPVTEFNREHLNVGEWPVAGSPWKAVDKGKWDAGTTAYMGTVPPVAFAADVSEDGMSASIGAAWYTGEHPSQRIVVHIPRDCSQPGTDWVIPMLRILYDTWRPLVLVVPKSGPAAPLGDAMEKIWGDRVLRPGSADEASAFSFFKQQVDAQGIGHAGEDVAGKLYKSLGNAVTRDVGDGGKALKRRNSAHDVTQASVVTLAAWGLSKKRRDYDILKSIG